MNNDPKMAHAAERARFIATIVVGVSILLDVFAAFVGEQVIDPATRLMAIFGAVMVVGVVFALPAGSFYLTLVQKRAGLKRKPITPGFLIVQAVVPFTGTAMAWIIALALGLQLIAIAAAVASVLAAALLWPTEKRLDLIIKGEAKVLVPVQ